jgi:hypothetical protein
MKATKQLKNYASVFAVATATLMPLALAATPASADDLFFPASLCQPSNAENAAKLTYRNNSLDVVGNSGVIVVCPIPTNVLIKKHLAIVRMQFDPARLPGCTLRSFGRDSSLLDSSTTAPTSSPPSQLVTESVIPGAYHTLTCALEPGSRLFNYRFVE